MNSVRLSSLQLSGNVNLMKQYVQPSSWLSLSILLDFKDNSSILLSIAAASSRRYIYLDGFRCVCCLIHIFFLLLSLHFSLTVRAAVVSPSSWLSFCTHSIIKMSLIQLQLNDLMANAKPITCNIIQSLRLAQCGSLSLRSLSFSLSHASRHKKFSVHCVFFCFFKTRSRKHKGIIRKLTHNKTRIDATDEENQSKNQCVLGNLLSRKKSARATHNTK